MSYAMMLLVVIAFVFAILGFSAIMGYFLMQAFPTKSSREVDSPEEALNRKI
ncbi:hypothetical protein [Lacicoccus alkaliphilus]|jgi:Na+-transporting NADH:ubiquinone oxidoreductase subunit NqrD|uniref:Uncharacterized protein n=1 Tax=Lacicoccus alkaliphilus DSM 16010 TaxID=1123231 RepID=A0A1M7KAT4_9BACL|nr:hypothetical protein [Salinicoccus alkaliphilus]SHM62093.1 hypothetical protein SAMN02745189_02489 [Salinicoccus alkaliphilus DSM 16010]